MPSKTAVCPLSPDNTSKHRFSPLAWGAEHWRDATISRQLNTPSAFRLCLVHTNTDTHTPALTHILAGDKRSQPRTKWGKLGSGVNEHSSHLFSGCYSGAPSVSPSNSRHLRLYMRAVQHIPQVTQVPHRQHWAHQQTARDMKSWLRVKSSPVEMCETALRHSWGPDTVIIRLLSPLTADMTLQVYMKEGLLLGSKPLISNPKKWYIWQKHRAGAKGRDDSLLLWPSLYSRVEIVVRNLFVSLFQRHAHTHIGMLRWIMRLLIQCHPTSVWGDSYSELSHNFHLLQCCQYTVKGLRPHI